MLTVEFKFKPLREQLEPVRLSYRKPDGEIRTATLEWKPSTFTYSLETVEKQLKTNNPTGHLILLNRNGLPSLENIPADIQYVHPNLLYYTRKIDGKTIAVVHPRNMSSWEAEDLDETFGKILNEKPVAIVIDLNDCAGGDLNQMQYLGRILDIKKEYRYYYYDIDISTGIRDGGISDFDLIPHDLKFRHVWNGKTILRVNPISGSACDYFARWFQLNNRGMIVGMPTAGRGGNTHGYTLDNTKTIIRFPFENGRIKGDVRDIEGNGVLPDYLTDESLEVILEDVIKKNK